MVPDFPWKTKKKKKLKQNFFPFSMVGTKSFYAIVPPVTSLCGRKNYKLVCVTSRSTLGSITSKHINNINNEEN